jgi:ketosteroid isomerase-like protein
MQNWMLLLLGVTACGRSAAGALGDGADVSALKAELVQIQQDWAKALQSRDTGFFKRTLAEEFTAAVPSHPLGNRAAFIKVVADTSRDVSDVNIEDLNVRLYAGGQVGVVTGRVRATFRHGADQAAGTALYTETFARRDGRWQAVVGHYSPLHSH